MNQTDIRLDGKPVDIRPALLTDLDRIIALDQDSTGLAKPEYWHQLFDQYHRRGEQRYFLVADRDGQFLGFIVGRTRAWEFGSPPSGWVVAVDLVADERETGIGTALFDRLGDTFRADGVTKLRTTVPRGETVILSFFRSQGMMASAHVQLEMDLDP